MLAPITIADATARARAGFLGSICGCILGKPVEIDPTLDELRAALTALGEWPLDDYISERLTTDGGLRTFNPTWTGTVRERITAVEPDDDINYTLVGYLVLAEHGLDFTRRAAGPACGWATSCRRAPTGPSGRCSPG